MITENLSTLKIHKLTQDQYDRELASGRIDPNALYLTPDEEIDLSGYATKDQLDAVDTSITELTNDNDAVHNELRAAIAAKSDFSGKYADLEGKPEIPSTEGLATVEQLNKINDSIANITNGTTKVEKATTADTATHATFADTATTAANATNAESASKDASGNVITSTYETKIDASAKLAEAKEYTNTAVANLLNNSTEAVDSIYELRDAMEENANVVDALEAAIGTKANTSDLTLHVSNVSNPHKVTLNQLGAIIKEGAGTNSLIVDEGVASGAHSVAGGTTDKTMINDLIGSAAGLLVNLEPAEATGAGSFSLGASTKSVAPGAMSIGVESIAGGKGYYIYAIDFTNKVITLSKKQTSQSKPSSLTWAKNDVVSIFYNTGHYECSKITNVNTTNGTITVDSLPITEFSRPTSILGVSSALPHDCTIYVVSKPTAGEVELGFGSYSRGYGNKTFGVMSNAIGYQNVAVDTASFVTGRENVGSFGSLVGGYLNKALKENSTAFGRENSALANYSFATGKSTTASGTYATSAGLETTASGNASQTSGYKTVASADNAHAEGNTTQATASQAHAEGYNSIASGKHSHAEGQYSVASGTASHAEGGKLNASGSALGDYTTITDGQIIVGSTASGIASHAEGTQTYAAGHSSHAEGYKTEAIGKNSHTEGLNTRATNTDAHAEGFSTLASGENSHAEGNSTEARANQSHVEGFGTVATLNSQHVQGKYNELDENGEAGNYAHIVGWGTSTARKNIHTLDTVGTAKYAGDVYARNKKLATEEYVNTKTNGLATKEYVDSKEVKLPFETVGGIVKLPRLILTDSVTGQDYYIEMQNGNLVSYAVNNNNSNDGYIIQGDTITLNGTWHDEDGQPLLIASSGYFYCDEGVHFNVDDIISFSGDVSNAKYTVTEVSYDPAQSEEYYVHFNGNYTPIDGDIVTKWLKQGE